MQIRELLSDDDAVSPVIGVILMVAITVILAAVIASFVLGLGDQAQSTTPQASISFNYEAASGSAGDGDLRITHDGGDPVKASELYIRGSGIAGSPSGSGDHTVSSAGSWDQAAAYGSSTEIVAGNFIIVGVDNDYDVNVVYEATEGDTSATLGSDKGPEA